MAELTWDDVGTRRYETGVDHGVLYIPDEAGAYANGVAWNGLTTVTESPTGAEANAQYADNIKYLNLYSREEFGATIEAFTYPDEFAQFDGLIVPTPGVLVGQQSRKTFGLSYRTKLGNDVDGDDYGFKLHLVYGATASPSEKAYATVNDSPEAINFSWAISTVPVAVTNMKPTSIVTINSTEVDETALSDLMRLLYGDTGVDPILPLPDDVIALFSATVTTTARPTAPSYNASTDTITIPSITGVTYYIDGQPVSGGVVITEDTIVTARPNAGYIFPPDSDDDWLIVYS